MKYPASVYAKALARAIDEAKGKNEDVLAKNFLALVRRNGDEGHLKKILEHAARLVRAAGGVRKVTIESARPLSSAEEGMISALEKANDVVERKIDSELIAGIRIVFNDEVQFDGSLRGKLDAVFKNI